MTSSLASKTLLLLLAFVCVSQARAGDIEGEQGRNICPLSKFITDEVFEDSKKLFYGFEYLETEEEIKKGVATFNALSPLLQSIIREARAESKSTRKDNWGTWSDSIPVSELVTEVDYISVRFLKNMANGRVLHLVDIAVGNGNGAYLIVETDMRDPARLYSSVKYEDFDGDLYSCISEGLKYKDFDIGDRENILGALQSYMSAYSKALTAAREQVVALMNTCGVANEKHTEFWDIFLNEGDEEQAGAKCLSYSAAFEALWANTSPKLPETEYTRYREAQTLNSLTNEVKGAKLVEKLSNAKGNENVAKIEALLERGYINDEYIGEEAGGRGQSEYGPTAIFEVAPNYFSRGDGCTLELQYQINERKAALVEHCD